jgi:tRNA threonylcarbamoyl adenosine modification protein (Sua5/YciO/YrdC/YwlC family)
MTRVVGADIDGLVEAERVLRAGEVVAIPTDTVYGLAVDPTVAGSVRRLYAVKHRPGHIPIAVLVGDAEQAWSLVNASVPTAAHALATRWWPGALTLVLPRRPSWPGDLGDDAATVGVRWPAHDWVQQLAGRVGPLATSSANLHGQPTPGRAAGIAELFAGAVELVIDGGPCDGAPSTVVDCTGPEPSVIRDGAIPAARLLG